MRQSYFIMFVNFGSTLISKKRLTDSAAHCDRVQVQWISALHALAVLHHGSSAKYISVVVEIGRGACQRADATVRFEIFRA